MRLKQIIGGERLVCEWIGTSFDKLNSERVSPLTPDKEDLTSELKSNVSSQSYLIIDITTDTALLNEMRNKSAIEKALPPQIFHGDEYLGVSVCLSRINTNPLLRIILNI